jgi:hypothetical protein
MAESDAILHECAARVGPTRVHSLRHGCNATTGGASIEGHFTANAAHFSSGPEWMPHAETPVRRRIYQRLRGWAGSAVSAGCDSARMGRDMARDMGLKSAVKTGC